MMRPAGRIVSSAFVSACGRASMECMKGTCALFHACEAVSAAVLRRSSIRVDKGKDNRDENSENDWSCVLLYWRHVLLCSLQV